MANQRSSDDLAPPLQAVLSTLNVNLEAELNRYRRNRDIVGTSANTTNDDLFADLDDPSFDLNAIEATVDVPAESTSLIPPPVPRNRKLFPAPPPESSLAIKHNRTTQSAPDSPGLLVQSPTQPSAQNHTLPSHASATNEPIIAHAGGAIAPTSYLNSSEELIDSLSEIPPLPEPVNLSKSAKSKRKTLSLIAGAVLGLLGLIAGLGASYLMSNPRIAQQVANGFNREKATVEPSPESTFEPPGPDLSAQEFIDIDIDNLSSLEMPQTSVNSQPTPGSSPLTPPATTSALPPISNEASRQPQLETQAAVIPTAGMSYYVTVPFTTEQGLLTIRQTVEEAFVRQFTDGVRIQIAAFDNPESAQQFVEEVKAQGIAAQVYGPTTE
ncbi:MAG: SPOR domain-containing protein [Phormidesmis sp. RL_2_1]|nr:SPOR domain-containing protein [Phormidesmis sp. RL_2_1]